MEIKLETLLEVIFEKRQDYIISACIKKQMDITEPTNSCTEEKPLPSLQLLKISSYKLQTIKAIKELCNIGLTEAKDLVDNRPCTIFRHENVSVLDTIKTELEHLGATVEIKYNSNVL